MKTKYPVNHADGPDIRGNSRLVPPVRSPGTIMEPLEPWLAEYVEQKAEDITRMITDRVKRKLQAEEKLRSLENDRLRVTIHDETPIALLPLPVRLLNALKRAGVETLGDLNGIAEYDIRRWRHVGRASLDHLQKFLTLAGRRLES